MTGEKQPGSEFLMKILVQKFGGSSVADPDKREMVLKKNNKRSGSGNERGGSTFCYGTASRALCHRQPYKTDEK